MPLGLAPVGGREGKRDWRAHLSCLAMGQIAQFSYPCLCQSLDVNVTLLLRQTLQGWQLTTAADGSPGAGTTNPSWRDICAAHLLAHHIVSLSYSQLFFYSPAMVGDRRMIPVFDRVVAVRLRGGKPRASQGNEHQALSPSMPQRASARNPERRLTAPKQLGLSLIACCSVVWEHPGGLVREVPTYLSTQQLVQALLFSNIWSPCFMPLTHPRGHPRGQTHLVCQVPAWARCSALGEGSVKQAIFHLSI